jgi:hypothetical protein
MEMMLLKNIKDIEALVRAINECKGDVLLRSTVSNEEFNMKSQLSRYVAIGELCKEHGDEWEIYCMDRSDEGRMLQFFYEIKGE